MKTARALAAGLALCVLLVYGPTLRNGFLALDDNDYVTQNPHVATGLSAANVAWALTAFHADNWHPLTWMSHMLDVSLSGMNPAGHHATSVLLHLLTTLLLFECLRRALDGSGAEAGSGARAGADAQAGSGAPAAPAANWQAAHWPAALAAALFALHPTRLESVAWISERKDVLAGFFAVCTLFAWGAWVRRRARTGGGLALYAAALVLCAAALASKPIAVTLPCVLLLLDVWPFARLAPWPARGVVGAGGAVGAAGAVGVGDWGRQFARLVVEKLPFFALAALSSFLTLSAQRAGGAVESVEGLPVGTRVANALVSYADYLRQVVWPGELAVVYPRRDAIPAVEALVAALVLVAVSAGVWRIARRAPYVLVGWLWFVGTLVPMIGLVQVGVQARADRYTYLPYVGLFVAVAFGLHDLARRHPARARTLAAAAAAGLFALMAWTLVQRAAWADSEALFRQALSATSGSELVHNNYGALLLQQGRPAEAIPQFEAALKINPRMTTARLSLARARLDAGDAKGAFEELDRAQQMAPRSGEVLRERGIALARTGRPADAAASFRAARELAPGDRRLPADLVRALAEAGRRDEAEAELRGALAAAPRDPALLFLRGVLADDAGRPAEAVAAFEAALSVLPDDVPTLNRLGVALARQGRLPEAVARFRRAVEIDPAAVEPRENLQRALAMTGVR